MEQSKQLCLFMNTGDLDDAKQELFDIPVVKLIFYLSWNICSKVKYILSFLLLLLSSPCLVEITFVKSMMQFSSCC